MTLPPLLRSRPFRIALLVFAALAGAGAGLVYRLEQTELAARREAAGQHATEYAHSVKDHIEQGMSATLALAAVLHYVQGDLIDFDNFAAELLPNYPGVSALQLAPRGVIAKSHPLAGNERAIGHDLLKDPNRNKEAFLALKTRRATLAGPFELIQGGVAVVGRNPVFMTDAAGREDFWGFSIALMKMSDLLKEAKLGELAEHGYAYQLWRTHPDTQARHVFAESAATPHASQVHFEFEVPNGKWTLSLAPLAGWHNYQVITGHGLIVLLVSLLGAALAYTLLRQPELLQQQVTERTQELAQANTRLAAEVAERSQAQEQVSRLNRLYAVLSQTNEAIVRIFDRQQLLEQVCRVAVEAGAMRLAWIGILRPGETVLRPAALAGAPASVMRGIAIPLADNGRPPMPSQITLREGRPFICKECARGPRSCAEDPLGGIGSCVSLPLRRGREVIGVFKIHAPADFSFDDSQLELLQEMSTDVSYALENIEREEQKRAAEDRFRNLVETSSDWIWEVDQNGRYTYASPKVADILGYRPEELLGKTPFDLMLPEEAQRVGALFGAIAAAQKPFSMLENANRHRDGRRVVLETSGTPVFDAAGAFRGYRGVDRDITRRKQAEERLRKLSRAVEQSANAVMITDLKGTIEYVNPKFCQITGYAPDEIIGQNPRILKGGEVPPETYREMWQALLAGQEWYGEFHNRRKSGELFWCLESISPLKNEQGEITHFVAVKEDINARKLAESTIRQLAYFDTLTGLPNRRLFHDRLLQAVGSVKRSGHALALLYLDIDRLKNINESLGHGVGDQLIKDIAARLESGLREQDTLARLGGDEFAIVLPEIQHVEDAARVAEKLLALLREPFPIAEHELFMTMSVGISVYPADTEDLEALNRNADTALNRAKQSGVNSFQFFTPDMNQTMLHHLKLESSLRRALERGEFQLLYQPQVDLASSRISGVEALIRWQHPELGLLPPGEFIRLAEESGLIVPLGEWVLRTACAQSRAWQDAGLPPLRVGVNLSSRQFRDKGLVGVLRGVLDRTGLAPELLEIEVTETILMDNVEGAFATLGELHRLGVRISVDDFGTGYSSLSYLKRMPIHVLKIDRSFVQDIGSDSDDRAIVSAVVALAHSLKLKVIAEGVETQEQLAYLRSLACDDIQGFVYSRPLAADALVEMLRRERFAPAVSL